MTILAVLAGVAVGAVFTYLWAQSRVKALAAEAARLGALEPELERQRKELTVLQVSNTRLEQEKLSLEKERKLVEDNFRQLAETYQAQFKALADKILEEKTKGLEVKNSEALRPLTLHLETFVKKVDDMARVTAEKQARLEKGLSDVMKSTEKIDESALNLTNAIKGQSIVRGSWGEEALKRILDAAGMKAGADYFEQVSEEGKRVDVQVALPGNRWIVVDSKTIFNHYVDFCNAAEPKQKDAFLDAHIKDLKRTIKDLASKKYYRKFVEEGDKVQPNYTLMFVYPESALTAAAEADPDVLAEAWKNNIALVSTTSLMGALKMVSKLWDVDKQQQYMEDFKEDIVKLMEKFNDFLINFAKTENAVSNAFESVKTARGHIDGNKGALLPVAQRIVNLYEVSLTKDNARLLKRMGYEYTGSKSTVKQPVLAQDATDVQPDANASLFD